MARGGSIDVFDYLDFRSFLRDAYLHGKEHRGLSYRGFSRRAGLKSPNFLKRVIDGERNISEDMAPRFAKALGLAGDAATYFQDLVRFNQARTLTQRNLHYARLTGSRRYRKSRKLELAHAAYHSTWYLPAIRELVARRDFQDDPQWIAAALIPPIGASEAKRALDTLLDLGLVTRDSAGAIRQKDVLLSTGPETSGLHIANYHRTMMERATAAIDLVSPADRDISSLTLCLGEDGLRRLKERIQRFRREILELSTLEDDPVQVVQLNFQLFPLSGGRLGNGS
jgi:uncharacterized protein (TIGR02147 family)